MILRSTVKRPITLVRDKVARRRRRDVVDDDVDHDTHLLGFGLADQVFQVGFRSKGFVELVDVL